MDQVSSTSSAGPRVRMLSQTELPGPNVSPLPSASVPGELSQPSSAAFLQQMVAVLSAIAFMVSARFLLLLGLAGASVLAYLATVEPTIPKLIANGVYDVLIFIPLVWLYVTRG